jgi:hypothetical protein
MKMLSGSLAAMRAVYGKLTPHFPWPKIQSEIRFYISQMPHVKVYLGPKEK